MKLSIFIKSIQNWWTFQSLLRLPQSINILLRLVVSAHAQKRYLGPFQVFGGSSQKSNAGARFMDYNIWEMYVFKITHAHTYIYGYIWLCRAYSIYKHTKINKYTYTLYINNIKHICKLYICMYINIYVNGTKIQVRNSTEK